MHNSYIVEWNNIENSVFAKSYIQEYPIRDWIFEISA